MTIRVDAEVMRGTFTLRLSTQLAGAATAVYGPSGSGKTTLLHLIAGLIRPTCGRVVLDDIVLDDTMTGIHVPPHRRRIGLVFQHGHLFPHLSVAENLRYGERLQPSGIGTVSFANTVDLLELGGLLARHPTALSGGERQRVALGRALLASPRLLLFDEPLASLEQRLKQQILPYLRRIRDDLQIPFVYVSHDLGEILQITQDLLRLEGGQQTARGQYADLIREPEKLPWLIDGLPANVLCGVVATHQAHEGLTTLRLSNGVEVRIPLRTDPVGTNWASY